MCMARLSSPTPRTIIFGITIAAWVTLALIAPWQQVNGHSYAVELCIALWGWAGWFTVALALLVPLPASLTAIRAIAPLALLCSFVAVSPAGIFLSLLVVVLLSSSLVVDVMVQGSAYGDEKRFALRTPVPYMAPMCVAWAALSGALIGGTILVCARNYVVGIPLLVAGAFLSRTVPLRLHRLARRWLVIVPAGIVIHDHLVLGETMMVMRKNVKSFSIVNEAGATADFTGGISGQRIAIEMLESEKVVLSDITAKTLKTTIALHVTGFSFAPRRLHAALAAITQK